MAHSPTFFRGIWGGLLDLKQHSPVDARLFALAVVTVSVLNGCNYCVSHHTPMAAEAGCSVHQLDALSQLRLHSRPANHDFPCRPGFDPAESLAIDLAYFIVWSGVYAPQNAVHPRPVYAVKQRLFAKLAARFTPQHIEELTWRVAQCVAFNWHNDFLELDIESGVTPLLATSVGTG